jgi:hypothetical protein
MSQDKNSVSNILSNPSLAVNLAKWLKHKHIKKILLAKVDPTRDRKAALHELEKLSNTHPRLFSLDCISGKPKQQYIRDHYDRLISYVHKH